MSTLLHNMSVPPRTEVRAEKRGIADRIVVFSLVYALTVRGFLEPEERPEKLPKEKEFQAVPWDSPSDPCVTIRERWPSPGDLIARIGDPRPIQITADFLIGWRVGISTDGSYFVPIRKLLPECKLAARVFSTSPAATPI